MGRDDGRRPDGRLGNLVRIDADASARFRPFELYLTVHLCKEGVIVADTDVLALVKLRPALADEDRARANDFPAEALDAQPLGVRISTVPR